jgi:hypothetical protein
LLTLGPPVQYHVHPAPREPPKLHNIQEVKLRCIIVPTPPKLRYLHFIKQRLKLLITIPLNLGYHKLIPYGFAMHNLQPSRPPTLFAPTSFLSSLHFSMPCQALASFTMRYRALPSPDLGLAFPSAPTPYLSPLLVLPPPLVLTLPSSPCKQQQTPPITLHSLPKIPPPLPSLGSGLSNLSGVGILFGTAPASATGALWNGCDERVP